MANPSASTAVVLSGGGGYGAFEVGVLKALCAGDRALDPGIFTGTSVGSFNAAVMSMQPGATASATVKRLEEIWVNRVSDRRLEDRSNGVFRLRGNPIRYLDLSIEDPARALLESASDVAYLAQDWVQKFTALASASGNLPRRAMGLVDLSAFITVEPFRLMLDQTLDLEGVRASDKTLRIVATNWRTGEAKVFGNADMTDGQGREIVLSSSAIPGIFPPFTIGTDIYVDGGVVMNTPLTCALEAGATELHVIYLDPDVSNIPIGQTSNTIDTFSRVYTMMLATKINEDIETAGWINGGLEALEKIRDGEDLTTAEERHFVRVAGKLLRAGSVYKKLTIHRYHPGEDLGGLLGMLDFTEASIARLLEKGFETGAGHDCVKSRCLLPV